MALPEAIYHPFNKSPLHLGNSLWSVPKPNWNPDSQSQEVLSLKELYAALETEDSLHSAGNPKSLSHPLTSSNSQGYRDRKKGQVYQIHVTSLSSTCQVPSQKEWDFFLILFLPEVPESVFPKWLGTFFSFSIYIKVSDNQRRPIVHALSR